MFNKIAFLATTLTALTAIALSNPVQADTLILPFTSTYQGDNADKFNKNTFGVGVTVDSVYTNFVVTGGTFRNAFSRQSNWLALGYRARVFKYVELGTDFGAVSGFGKKRTGSFNGIVPAIMPSLGIKTTKGLGVEVMALPPVSAGTTWQAIFRVTAPL